MKSILIAVLAVATLVLGYDEKFDKIDIDKIINDEKLFNGYTDCFLGRGPCELEHSEEYKKLLPEVIATACAKCSPAQKVMVRKSIKALQEKKPEDFKSLREKFDPKGEYEKEFTKFMLSSD